MPVQLLASADEAVPPRPAAVVRAAALAAREAPPAVMGVTPEKVGMSAASYLILMQKKSQGTSGFFRYHFMEGSLDPFCPSVNTSP